MTRVGSLCTGYGGIELGLALAGMDVDLRWLAENDPALTPLHGGVLNHGDITRVDWSAVEGVELLTAGFPCQPVSAAGRHRGVEDDRWLWPHVTKAIDYLRPTRVLLENVRNLVSICKGELWRGMCEDLLSLGYGVRWLTLGACHVGAAHHRHRVFALAEQGTGAGVERVVTTSCGARGLLLPTPTSGEHTGAGHSGAGGRNLRTVVSHGDVWGRFADAIARQGSLCGPAPSPTEANRNDAPRLAPAFAEWLMCLPAGHVTAKLERVPALRAIGNGVCPPQLAAAWALLGGAG
jgi:DNA (cytosine-5)-methyltransferase 1